MSFLFQMYVGMDFSLPSPSFTCPLLNCIVATPLLEECEDDIHILEMETWESSKTPRILEFDCRGQNISP